MSDTEVDYLQPEFDPSSVTMPRLRSILVSHNVPYPATAKKAQLVEIFNENVIPQAKKILDRRARAKRSSLGITNADNSLGYTVANNDYPPPSASRPRGRSKKNPGSAANSFRNESAGPEKFSDQLNLSPRKRQARSASRQLGFSDTDTDSHYEARPSPRKFSRQPNLTPQPEIKREDVHEDDHNVFSTENPFQSGSSPLSEKTPSNRRRTTGFDAPAKKTTTSATRWRTETPHDDSGSRGYSKSNEVPSIKKSSRTKFSEPEPLVEAGEEFTPEEQLALAQEDADRAQNAVVRHRQKKSSSLSTPIRVLLLTLLGAYGAWYRQEKIAVGYCGAGRPTQQMIPRHFTYQDFDFVVPKWVIKLAEPECEPCPAHAYCYNDNSVRCEDDYVLKPHPLAAGGIVPLPPTCEPDGEKVRRVKAVADKAIEELRERRAKFECGEPAENGKALDSPSVNVDELKEVVSGQRSKKLSQREFDDLWAAALGEIESRDEVEVESGVEPVSQQPQDAGSRTLSKTRIASTSVSRIPLTCAVHRSVRLGLERHRLGLVSVASLLLIAFNLRSRFLSNRAITAQVPVLVDLVLERLVAQKELAYQEDGEDDPFLFLPNMRDDVLRSVHSLSKREKIWQRVRAVVEQNTNVRTGQREGHNGEIGRAWEWIGPSSIGDNSGRRKRPDRASWGPDKQDEGVFERSVIHHKWEQPGSRPIY